MCGSGQMEKMKYDQQDNRIVLHDCLEEIYIHVRSKTTGVNGLGKTI